MELEKEEPKNNVVVLYLLLSTLVTFVVVVALYFFLYQNVMREQIRVKIELAPTAALDTLRHRETELLGQDIHGRPVESYARIEPGKPLFRIPIEQAMALEARAPWRANLKAPVAAAPALNDANTTATN